MSAEAHAKTYHIIVNGQKKEVGTNVLSYDDVVNLAFDNNPPKGENVVITVTFSKAEDDKQGTLIEGQRVEIKNGTIFNVKATDRS
jgi:hypothetical protein